MNFARTAFHFSLVLPITTFLIACGGVDDGDTGGGNPDLSSISSCMQDTWSRTIQGSSGIIDLTYEFLENGTYIERSHVDNISTAEYIGGIRNTDLDLDVLPGLSIDVGTALGVLGAFYTEGYFYVAGTWSVDEASGVVTTSLPKTTFGHSIWSASGARNDFNRSSSSSSNTVERYAYCKSDKLVVGAFRKDDDSDIAGSWDNLKNEFFVAEDHSGASLRYRDRDGDGYDDIYRSYPYRMNLKADGYSLAACSGNGGVTARTDQHASFYLIDDAASERITPTGVAVPDDPTTSLDEVTTENYLYRFYDGLVKRLDIQNGEQTTLADLGSKSKFGSYALIDGGLIVVHQTYNTSTKVRTTSLTRILDNSNTVLTLDLGENSFYEPIAFGERIILDAILGGIMYIFDPANGQLTTIPFDAPSSYSPSYIKPSVDGDKLFTVQNNIAGTATSLWVFSNETGMLDEVTDLDFGLGVASVYLSRDGFNVSYTDATTSELHIVHLSEANDYAPSTNVVVTESGRIEGVNSEESLFVVSINGDDGLRKFRLVNAITGESNIVSIDGHNVDYYSVVAGDASRVIYDAAPESGVFGEDKVVVLNIADNGTVTQQIIEYGAGSQFEAVAAGGISAFTVNPYQDELGRALFYFAPDSTPPMQLMSTEYTYGVYDAAFADEFLVTDAHFMVQARTVSSNRELLIYNPANEEFDFVDLNPIPDVSSSPKLHGSMGSKTLISAWNVDNTCFDAKGSLKFENGYLWYEIDGRGLAGGQWFSR